MFLKMSLRERLVCLADFVWLTLLAVFFLLPLPNCFLSVCLARLYAALLKFFLTRKKNICISSRRTSAFPRATNSNESTPMRFAAAKDIFKQEWNCSSPNILSKCTETAPTLLTNTSAEWKLYFS